jgi:hypothetical protein
MHEAWGYLLYVLFRRLGLVAFRLPLWWGTDLPRLTLYLEVAYFFDEDAVDLE